MSEALNICFGFWRRSMSKPYSLELRERVVEWVASGAPQEAAERFEVGESSEQHEIVVRKGSARAAEQDRTNVVLSNARISQAGRLPLQPERSLL
jgi:hypothetical protein